MLQIEAAAFHQHVAVAEDAADVGALARLRLSEIDTLPHGDIEQLGSQIARLGLADHRAFEAGQQAIERHSPLPIDEDRRSAGARRPRGFAAPRRSRRAGRC